MLYYVTGKHGLYCSADVNINSTDNKMEDDSVFEELSFFLHKTNGALMMLVRYEDFGVDFDDDDGMHNCSKGALRVRLFIVCDNLYCCQ